MTSAIGIGGLEGHWETYALLGGFAAVAVWETLRPLRTPVISTARRWINHALLWLVGNAAGLWALRIGAALAASAWAPQAGLLHSGLFENVPLAAKLAVGVLALDLLRYGQHFLYHAIPWLWRVHQVHHADAEFDVTTGLRFHPIEVLLDQAGLLAAVAILGLPPQAVAAFGIAGAAQDMLVHANASSRLVEGMLGWFVVTPDVHRIHHSVNAADYNRNFGFIFPWWDRMFRTYSATPAEENREFAVGLPGYRDVRSASLWRMLAMPVWTGSADAEPAVELGAVRTSARHSTRETSRDAQ